MRPSAPQMQGWREARGNSGKGGHPEDRNLSTLMLECRRHRAEVRREGWSSRGRETQGERGTPRAGPETPPPTHPVQGQRRDCSQGLLGEETAQPGQVGRESGLRRPSTRTAHSPGGPSPCSPQTLPSTGRQCSALFVGEGNGNSGT